MADILKSIQDYFQTVNLTALLIVSGLVALIFVIKQPLVTLILQAGVHLAQAQNARALRGAAAQGLRTCWDMYCF